MRPSQTAGWGPPGVRRVMKDVGEAGPRSTVGTHFFSSPSRTSVPSPLSSSRNRCHHERQVEKETCSSFETQKKKNARSIYQTPGLPLGPNTPAYPLDVRAQQIGATRITQPSPIILCFP
ncbi:hypothetical protein PCANC_08160 [Puccinia coronata f. sp. avenae]|uniref:Uncharacterized protein n=1 Tax=Puccinia coronata f. sp. avenae TaxID=200324 RepID=A0A2N5S698_9BASI|nr:hypothetical protein PCANC_21876 [Puccinia coronata f. sp. avenae]PLW51011.1 hypothetical protein PCANC_08160 [Puccinia coronata f. sp. avenae]